MSKNLHMTSRERLAGLKAGKTTRSRRPDGARADGRSAPRPRMSWFALPVLFLMSKMRALVTVGIFLAMTALPAFAAQVHIINTAWLHSGTTLLAQASVTVTNVERTNAALKFHVYRPGSPLAANIVVQPTEYSPAGSPGTFNLLPPPDYNGSALPVGVPLPLVSTSTVLLHAGEPLFITLSDGDQNLDPARPETVLVRITSAAGDTESLRLTETGNNTGVFSGYLMTLATPSGAGDGLLEVTVNGRIDGLYTDIYDGTDSAADTALVDPLGIVFDSRSGTPLDGATVNLYRLANLSDPTGVLATGFVFDDDGTTPFPASVASGDAGLGYGPGGFRFPLIVPGFYRLEVIPPANYTFPSTAVIDPGLPYAVVNGSRGEAFEVVPGPVINIDIPLDPLDSILWMNKTASRSDASSGDFLQYRLTVENSNATATASQVSISDRLPTGFRYQRNSSRLNGSRMADPQIGSDGRTLTFAIGDIPPNSRMDISYVVEVTAGARAGKAVNFAQASESNGNLSNLASATVEVRNAFFNDTTFLLGSVLDGACTLPEAEKKGLAGIRIYLEDGTYAVTDKDGKFHFEGVAPGVHVVQLDTITLPPGYEMLPCEQTSQSAGRSFSQFVDLRGGTLWRINFHAAPKPAPTGEMSLEMSAALDDRIATFTIEVASKTIPAENVRLTVMLPGGFSYLEGSAQRDGKQVADPQLAGDSIRFDLKQLPANRSTTWAFKARLDGTPASGELPAKAMLHFDTPAGKDRSTPTAETRFRHTTGTAPRSEEIKLYPRFPSFVAELQATDLAMLEELSRRLQGQRIVRLDIVGHTDNQKIAAKSRHIFADNLALSMARAQSVADVLKEHVTLADDAISIRAMGESMPVAENTTENGRALNRRVELYLVTETAGEEGSLTLTAANSGKQAVPVNGRSPAGADHQDPVTQTAGEMEDASRTGLLTPRDGSAVNRIEAVRLRLDSKLKPRLSLDGREIPADRIGFSMSDPDRGTTVYTYIGVDFGEPGLRTLLIEGIDPFGNARFTQTAVLTRTGEIRSIRLLEVVENQADGRTPVRMRVELIDQLGRPVQSRTQLSFESDRLRPLPDDSKAEQPSQEKQSTLEVTVDPQGWISFKPVDQSGRYSLLLSSGKARLDTEIYVKPAMRDWILVGFAEGTVGYNTFSGNQVSLKEAGIDEHFYEDGRVKFFAKGAIKGEWLLTMAYDSDKPKRDGDSLHQQIDPDSYYPLYGDGTQQGYEAASARKLFVKLERDQFYALFGDMQTGLTQTQLSQYSRSMNGFKSEMQTENFSYTLFAADTNQAFTKDEIRGDGTSGRYYLSQKKLVINSEEVTIETRDRFRSERIIESRTLTRHTDYDIDYDTGSLFFKRPVPSKDEKFNPIFIVVRYETRDSADSNFNYGGRVAAKILDQKVEVGASYIHEEKGSGKSDLYGTDVTVKLTPQTTLRAEAATTESRHFDDKASGDAYQAEVTHEADKLRGRVYYREQQEGFGLGQQNGSETGTRKYGVEGNYDITQRQSVQGLAYHEDNLGTGGKRDVAEITGRYRADRYSLHTGVREARDRLGDGSTQRSTQGLVGGSWNTADGKLTLRSEYEQSLASSDENSAYPTLLTLGADYRLSDKVSVFAEQEFSWGATQDSEGTRAGFRSTPWQGGTLNSSVERQFNENGQRVFALFGLGQTWQINERWSIDGSLDRSHTLAHPGNDSLNTNVPQAHGSAEDFTAVSVGATYKRDKWTWWNRLEVRHSENEDKYGASTSIISEPRNGIAISAKAMAFITDSSTGLRSSDGNLRLGLAYRPAASRWVFLNRLDFYFDTEDGGTEKSDSWRIVNNFHANFRLSNRLQTSFYSGLKYVRSTYSGDSYSGFTSLTSFEARYNLTRRWDIGVHGSVLHSWNSGNFDYSAGASVGYSPLTNTWVSVGYNFVGFRDDDFASANYTAQGAYMRFRAKFDQQSVREAAEWINK